MYIMDKIVKQIFNIIKQPHKIPSKIFFKLKSLIEKFNYDEKKFIEKQNQKYVKLNLNRKMGLEKLIKIKNKYKIPNREMSSEHEIFFSSLSLNSQMNFKKILEIGTFDGNNAYLLSLIFPNAEIDTIDLESSKDDFINFYDRKNSSKKFSETRNSILEKNDKINFIEMNSIGLCNNKEKYDLIWIDGAHGYPFVCIDIINSLRLINSNGIIMCDDVYINNVVSDKMYKSTAAFEVLTELKKEKIINFNLIYKRLNLENNSSETNRKFIAVFNPLKDNTNYEN